MSVLEGRRAILRRLGFTDLEADVYTALAAKPGMTAYAIARATGKPTANVYKAVESLARNGAVLVEDGDKRMCRAVPPELLLTRLEQAAQRDIVEARALFAEPELPEADERVYRLEVPSEVIARCNEMLDRAERVAVVDAFPAALEVVSAGVTRAAKRGVRVFVEAYAPCSLPGADVVVVAHAPVTLRRWRSEQLNVVVDGREHVAALLSEDLSVVHQAIWSDSLYLSCLMHAGRLAEHTLIKMTRLKPNAAMPADMKRVLNEHPFFANSEVPGHLELVERFTRSGDRAVDSPSRPRRHK
jgi:sugar-specific transcriptional regulator TrmB